MGIDDIMDRVKSKEVSKEIEEDISIDDSNPNYLIINSKTGRIKSLDDLVKVCNIDLKVWRIDSHTVNTWENASKAKSGKIIVTPIYQVKARLSKIKPTEQEFPTISKVEVTCNYKKSKKKNSKTKIKRAIHFSDAHFGFTRDIRTGKFDPFHDRKAMDILCQVIDDLQPDIIIESGDGVDLPDWSDKFIRSPEFYYTTQPTIVEKHWWLSRISKVSPNSVKYYEEGNHEDRMRRAIFTNMSQAYNISPVEHKSKETLLSIENLLSLDKLGWNFVGHYPDEAVWINRHLYISHGDVVRSGSGKTVTSMLKSTYTSRGFGHIHRMELAGRTVHGYEGDKSYLVYSPGCVCRIDGKVPAKSKKQNWQQGFAIIDYQDSGDERFNVNLISINDGKAIALGKLYEGVDRAKEISKDTGWNFI